MCHFPHMVCISNRMIFFLSQAQTLTIGIEAVKICKIYVQTGIIKTMSVWERINGIDWPS
jgi:hypothetical protein